ncbi:hypothetical protein DPMN_083276 [Dreissena polymorpha]|uniref:Uncharacterized protein n=1 Tax=Dreissena polymorpha TaxID=45954 RepID=A0A9D3Y9M4_DREPO|nr:hypothetical protein DPMN_083276 [Dreissena polymorpha]
MSVTINNERSCIDQIATLRIILEQSLDRNSPLFVNFTEYENAFLSIDRKHFLRLVMKG